MNCSPQYVSSNLSALYSRDLCGRKPHPRYPHRYLYYPKLVQGSATFNRVNPHFKNQYTI
jgi:hypothetical protein